MQAISAVGIVRHETAIGLPTPQTIELAVEGPPGPRLDPTAGLRCFRFPTGRPTIDSALLNNGQTDRTVDVEILALDAKATFAPPAAALDADDAARLLARFGSDANLWRRSAKISVPAGAKSVPLPFPLPGEKKGPRRPMPETEGAKPSAAPRVLAAAPAAARPPRARPRRRCPVLDNGW